MKYVLKLTISALIVMTTLNAMAADSFDSNARAAAITPFLDDEVVAVVRVDLSRFDLAASMKVLADVTRASEEDRALMQASQQQVSEMLAMITKVGGGEFYAVISLADIPLTEPFLIATVKEGGDQDQLVRILTPLFARGDEQTCEKLGDVVYCGPRKSLDRLRTLRGKERPALAEAFKAAGDTTAQLIITLSDDHRRVIREMLPRIPEQIGGGDGAAVADGLQWAAIGIQSPPKLAVNITVQSKDEQSAAALKRVIVGSLKWMDENTPVREVMPKFDTLIELAETPAVFGDRLVVSLDNDSAQTLILSMAPAFTSARGDARRHQCTSNLKQLALAMHNYHDVHKRFPAAASYDADGKPLLSWRVQLLPYLEANDLYKQFHLDEPWDSEHNRSLIEKMPQVFTCPAAKSEPGTTVYLGPFGEGLAFEGKGGIRIRDFTDGTSNTIMFVEANSDQAVIWTKPADLNVDLENPLRGLGATHEKGFNAVFTDGAVHFINEAIDTKVLRILFTRNGGEPTPEL